MAPAWLPCWQRAIIMLIIHTYLWEEERILAGNSALVPCSVVCLLQKFVCQLPGLGSFWMCFYRIGFKKIWSWRVLQVCGIMVWSSHVRLAEVSGPGYGQFRSSHRLGCFSFGLPRCPTICSWIGLQETTQFLCDVWPFREEMAIDAMTFQKTNVNLALEICRLSLLQEMHHQHIVQEFKLFIPTKVLLVQVRVQSVHGPNGGLRAKREPIGNQMECGRHFHEGGPGPTGCSNPKPSQMQSRRAILYLVFCSIFSKNSLLPSGKSSAMASARRSLTYSLHVQKNASSVLRLKLWTSPCSSTLHPETTVRNFALRVCCAREVFFLLLSWVCAPDREPRAIPDWAGRPHG